jgi:hypothetical protein
VLTTPSATIPDADLSSNVPLKASANTFTADQKISKVGPRFVLDNTTQAADARKFAVEGMGATLVLNAWNDAETTSRQRQTCPVLAYSPRQPI